MILVTEWSLGLAARLDREVLDSGIVRPGFVPVWTHFVMSLSVFATLSCLTLRAYVRPIYRALVRHGHRRADAVPVALAALLCLIAGGALATRLLARAGL